MPQRKKHASGAARQKAYRDRKRNAPKRNAGLEADVARLAPLFHAIDPAWILRVSDDGRELELIGNGPPAAWRTVASCEDWITHQRPRRRGRF